MLDILSQALWILGLAGVLATLSYTNWRRQTVNTSAATGKTAVLSWKEALQTTEFARPFHASMFLTCVGIGASGWQGVPPAPLWQTILWFVLALLFAIQFLTDFKHDYTRSHE